MNYRFNSYGHENILSKHRNTIEFTKDKDLTPKGDCIIGVDSDFDYKALKDFLKKVKETKLLLTIKVKNIKEKIIFEPNHKFKDKHEIVIRKTDYLSDRTLGINADKAAKDLNKKLVELMKNPNQKIEVEINIKKSQQ